MNDDSNSTTAADTTASPNRGGRKPVPDDERLRPRSIRMTDDDWLFLTQLGGATWMRGALARERKLAKRRAAAAGGA